MSFCLAGTGAEEFNVCWGSSLSSAIALAFREKGEPRVSVCPAGKTEADESDDC